MGGDTTALGGVDAGVTPRLCLELFQTRDRIESEGHSKWTVEVGYIEVYNERVSDLLAKRKKGSKEEVFVEVREHPTRGVFIEGQRLREVSCLDDVVELIEAGNRVRHTAATKMNDRSSRSHAIFMLMLREERSMVTATGQTITTAGKNSRMNLVDLAGSERVAQSEVVGQQFSEARYINLSLTTLGRVIDMLADMAKNADSQWSMPPYRESKLTFILKDSLGGNSKTFMIATISPSVMNYEETLSTLRYASRARDIVNVAKVNEDPRARRIRELEEQMEQMRQEIQGKDPAYVAELEEKLVLLEAEAQKRAADLQALEKEREKNEIREKMLRATEAERQELLGKASDLERQVNESRRQAEYYEQMNQRLKEEHAQRERELLEQVRRREAEMESVRRRKDAEVVSGQEQLRKTMQDLERERTQREDALRTLCEQQAQLSAALNDSRQSEEQRAELQRQNVELSKRMRQLESEREAQQRLLHDLERFRDERDALEQAVALLRTELEEMETRHKKTAYYQESVLDLWIEWVNGLVGRLGVEHERELNQNAQTYADDRAMAECRWDAELKEQYAALSSAHEAMADLQQRLDQATAIQQHLRDALDALKRENKELAEQQQAMERAKAEVERSLESMTAERDGLQQRLASTSDELNAERSELGRVSGSLSEVLEGKKKLEEALRVERRNLNACQVRLKYLRALHVKCEGTYGKTYTMMGGDTTALGGVDAGVTPRLCLELFQTRDRIESEGHSKWTVEVGYIEVYNERVSDLLAKRKKGSKEEVFVEVREHPTRGVFIEGQRLREVSCLDDVVELIEAGNRVRHTAATKMNDRSSRSHAIFMLMLREERSMVTATGQTITTAGKNSRMNLVDLAGSERVAQSEVVGQQFSEARYINLSLTTLGRVIDMLADMAKNADSQWSMPPYRESKLTFILKDSLGGNSKTFMIATISPSVMNYEETLSTLRYASRARDIVNVAKVNEDPRARRIRELEEQMEQMRQEIQGKDPAYVAELEEKLVLLEAEAQKRAADLQALEKEREKNEIREKMLRATEAERQELLGKASDLERQVNESRRQAEYYEQMNQRLKEEHAQRERELLEQVRRREAEMESVRRRKDAEVVSGQEQLRKTMQDLERERTQREDALRTLCEQQAQLSAALNDSRQSEEQRAELQRQNVELSKRMRQFESEREAQQRLLHDLERFRDERDALEQAVALLRTELEEMETRHKKTAYYQESVLDLWIEWVNGLVGRLGVEHERELNQNAQTYADDRAMAKCRWDAELKEQYAALSSAHEAMADLQQRLDQATAIQQHLRDALDALKRENKELAEQQQAMERAKAEVERSLESMTAERDGLQQRLASTSDELCELKGENESLSVKLQQCSVEYEAVNVRLNLWRSNGKMKKSPGAVLDYPLTQSVVNLRK
ncbi:Kinesin motor domain [Trypanosoma melophagium]|uniref:Kinesin motor domain n=1 Tax=Trypanosoma melophagium TaxID=715481 RepID=UPI00351A0292|nr:Kinesin motor domain [Trypanosoma melophagium]